MSTETGRWDRRRVARYILLATFLVVVLATSFRSHDVVIRYTAPPGELKVVLFDADGDRLRTTWFRSEPREHTVSLVEGSYQVRMVLKDGFESECPLTITDRHPVFVEWCGKKVP